MSSNQEIRKLEASKANIIKVKKGVPVPSEGRDGDLSVRIIGPGLALYGKFAGKWYHISSLKEPVAKGGKPIGLPESRHFYDVAIDQPVFMRRTDSKIKSKIVKGGAKSSSDGEYGQLYVKKSDGKLYFLGPGASAKLISEIDISGYSDVTPANGDKLFTLDSDGATEQLTTLNALATLFAGTAASTGLSASSSVLSVSDLHPVGVNGANNQLLTDDGDGTVTSEAGLTWDASDLSATSTTASKPELLLTNNAVDSTSPVLRFYNNRNGGNGADLDRVGTVQFRGNDASGNVQSYAECEGKIVEADHNSEAGELIWRVANGASGLLTVDAITLDGNIGSDGFQETQFKDTSAGFIMQEVTSSGTGTTTDLEIDFRKGNKYNLSIAGDITNLNCIFPSVSCNCILIITSGVSDDITNWKAFKHDGVAATVTDFLWSENNHLTLSAGAETDIISILWDATNEKAYAMGALDFS